MKKRLLLLTFMTSVSWSFVGIAMAQTQPEFRLGFLNLASQIPDVVGQPLEDEHWGANGDSLQQTTKGLMVWRKADNWTAFTNGSRSWVNGPYGVMERGNEERFEWERDLASPAPAPLQPQPSPTVVATPNPAQQVAATPAPALSPRPAALLDLPVDSGLVTYLRRDSSLGTFAEYAMVQNFDFARTAVEVDIVEYRAFEGEEPAVFPYPAWPERMNLGPGNQSITTFGLSPAQTVGVMEMKAKWMQSYAMAGKSAAILYFATWKWRSNDGSLSRQVRSPYIVGYSN